MGHKHDFETWPFSEPVDTCAYTTNRLLDNEHPILLVSHDNDGDWQMLCGTTSEAADGRVVCRDQADSAWIREPNPEFEESAEWDQFVATAVEYLCARQDRFSVEFELDSWERYDYDQEEGTIKFSSFGKVGVIADIQVVGSTSKSGGTWLWSSNNESILPQCKGGLDVVRTLGDRHGYQRLVTDKWPADEQDGWEMAAVASFVLGSEGAYRVPDDNGALFLVLHNLRRQESTA